MPYVSLYCVGLLATPFSASVMVNLPGPRFRAGAFVSGSGVSAGRLFIYCGILRGESNSRSISLAFMASVSGINIGDGGIDGGVDGLAAIVGTTNRSGRFLYRVFAFSRRLLAFGHVLSSAKYSPR